MTAASEMPSGKSGSARGSVENQHAILRRLLYRGASGAFLVQVGGAGLGLIVHVVLARLMGITQYGVYTLALTWVSLFSVLALLGQSTSVVRFVPTYAHRGRWGELRGLRRGARLIVFAASSAIILVGALVVYLLRRKLGTALELTLLAGFVLLPVLAQLQLNGALILGLKRAASSSIFNSLLRPVILLGLVLVFSLVLRGHLTAPIAMLASGGAALAALASSEWFLTRVWPAEARRKKPRYEARAWFVLGRQLLFMAVIGIVLNRVDVLILGGMAGAGVVGPYYAAVQLAAIALYGLNSVNTILAPMIAERYAAGDHQALAWLVHRAAWLTFVVTAVIAIVTAIVGRWILDLFGHGFSVAYVPLLVILGGQCVSATCGPVGFLMTMTRFERQAPLFFGGGAMFNLLLSVLLIPKLGLLGAAVATASATVVWNASALMFVRQRLGVNPTILPLPVR